MSAPASFYEPLTPCCEADECDGWACLDREADAAEQVAIDAADAEREQRGAA